MRSRYDSIVLHGLGNRNRILFRRKALKSRNTQCRIVCDERLLSYQYDLGVNMKIVMTTKEYEETKDNILVDPCAFIDCTTLTCNHCPLRETAQQLREAQDNFMNIVGSIYQGE